MKTLLVSALLSATLFNTLSAKAESFEVQSYTNISCDKEYKVWNSTAEKLFPVSKEAGKYSPSALTNTSYVAPDLRTGPDCDKKIAQAIVANLINEKRESFYCLLPVNSELNYFSKELQAPLIDKIDKPAIAQLAKMFPAHASNTVLLLQDYQDLIVKTGKNLNPPLTEFLKYVQSTKLNLERALRNLNTDKESWDHNVDYSLVISIEHYENVLALLHLKTVTLSDVLAKLKNENSTLVTSVASQIEIQVEAKRVKCEENLTSTRASIEQRLQELNQFQVNKTFLEVVKSRDFLNQENRDYLGSGGYSSTDISLGGGSGAGGSGGSSGGGSGSIMSMGSSILVCRDNACKPAQFLFGNYYYAAYSNGYLVVEQPSLKHAFFTNRLLSQVVKEQACYLTEKNKVSYKQYGKAFGISLAGTAATMFMGIGETVVDGYMTIWNRKWDMPYENTNKAFSWGQNSASAQLDGITDHKVQSTKTYSAVTQKVQTMIKELIKKESYSVRNSSDYQKLTCESKLNNTRTEYSDNLQ